MTQPSNNDEIQPTNNSSDETISPSNGDKIQPTKNSSDETISPSNGDEIQPTNNSSDETISPSNGDEIQPTNNTNNNEEEDPAITATRYCITLNFLYQCFYRTLTQIHPFTSSLPPPPPPPPVASPFSGQVFQTWDDVDEYFNDYALQENFVIIKVRNEQDPPPERTYRRRTFACDH